MAYFKKLFSGVDISVSIRTDERIFQVVTFDGETVLCNLPDAQKLISTSVCKSIKHYWNNKFTSIGKGEVISMG